MKDHAPIKRHQAIVSFSKDHHFGLLLVWKIRQGLNKAVSAERISNYVLFFLRKTLKNILKKKNNYFLANYRLMMC